MVRVRWFLSAVLALLGVCLVPRSALAATDLYLQFDPDLHGSSTEVTHAAWILVDSYSMGSGQETAAMTRAGAGAGRAAEAPKLTFSTSDMSVVPKLREAVAKGTHFRVAVLDVKKAGKPTASEYLKITMADVIITSAAMRPGLPTKSNSVTFTLQAAKETVEYSTADGAGARSAPQTPPATWDIKTAKAE